VTAPHAFVFEIPPGRLRGLMKIVSCPSPQSTVATALPRLTQTRSSPDPASIRSGPVSEWISSLPLLPNTGEGVERSSRGHSTACV
jgi:hypothetical protein